MSTRHKPRPAAAQLAAEDWVMAALEAIAAEGLAGASVERLARRLGVTKGSFYWHFENQAALLAAALARWEALATDEVIAALEAEHDPRARLENLLQRVHAEGLSSSLHVALSAAADHPLVQPCLRRVSERRIRYVEHCLVDLGLTRPEARSRATLAYAAYVGFLHLRREMPDLVPSGRALAAYRAHVIRTLIPPP
jgi:AcrR family transcriptional regulator